MSTSTPAADSLVLYGQTFQSRLLLGTSRYPSPAVLEAAVVGRPDPRWQEVPVAFVVPRPGRACDAEALRGHLLDRLARYKVPRELRVVPALPRNAMGKVQKNLLRDQFGDLYR